MPLFQFLVLRWYFRFFIWGRFLAQVARIGLNLEPTHPDATAGLLFLARTGRAFRLVLLALGTVLSGMIANRIFHDGAKLLQFKVEILGTALVLTMLVLGPLVVFYSQLRAARREGMIRYGILGQAYAREFHRKWMRGPLPTDEPLLGSADFQSLADLHNGFEVVRGDPGGAVHRQARDVARRLCPASRRAAPADDGLGRGAARPDAQGALLMAPCQRSRRVAHVSPRAALHFLGIVTTIAGLLFAGASARAEEAGDADSLAERDALTGDWGGGRTWLKEHGVTIAPRLSQFYQGISSGDGEHGYEYGGKADLRVGLDLGRLGLWDGFSMTVQADFNFGDTVNGRAGVLIPPNTALNSPGIDGADAFDVSSLYFGQSFGKGVALLVGKMNMIEVVASKPFMGGAGIDSFWNHTFTATPSGTVPPYLVGVLGSVFTERATYRLWVFDPSSYVNRSVFDDGFEDGVSVRASADFNVTLGGRPGHQSLSAFYSTQDGTDLSTPRRHPAADARPRGGRHEESSLLLRLRFRPVPLPVPRQPRRRLRTVRQPRSLGRQPERPALVDVLRRRRHRPDSPAAAATVGASATTTTASATTSRRRCRSRTSRASSSSTTSR